MFQRPKKRIEVLWCGMAVYAIDNNGDEQLLKQDTFDFHDPGARAMLAKTAWWAMHQGHELVTWPLRPGETVQRYDSREGGEPPQ